MLSRKYIERTMVQADRSGDGEGTLYGLRSHTGTIVSKAEYHRCDVNGTFVGMPDVAPVIQLLLDRIDTSLPESRFPYTVVARADIDGGRRWRATVTTYGWHIVPVERYHPALFSMGHNAGKCRVAAERFTLTSHGHTYMVCSGYPQYTRIKEENR